MLDQKEFKKLIETTRRQLNENMKDIKKFSKQFDDIAKDLLSHL